MGTRARHRSRPGAGSGMVRLIGDIATLLASSPMRKTEDRPCAASMLVLGFRRLSILDLSEAGNQPMLTNDRRFALVFKGELYNFRELRQTLASRGFSFRSTGDAEVVLYTLAEYGVEASPWRSTTDLNFPLSLLAFAYWYSMLIEES